ncbi:MAG: IS110 family transposase [Balneolaceae bacterium]|nr:IS110 family transposase [Balneolaceae bacterium]
MIHVGIDLHFTNMVNSAINDKGEEIWFGKLPATEQSLQDFFDQFDEPVQAVVECTSFWYWVADWCKQHNVALTLAHAKMLKAISYAKVKTDKVDARTLAELLRVGLIPEAHMQMGSQRNLRELTRARLRMVHRREQLQSSLWNLVARYNVKLHDFETGWRYPEQLGPWLTAQLPEVVHLETDLLLKQIIQIQDHIHQLEQWIEEQAGFTEELERVMVVPGVGLVNGWTILAEVGEILRFPSDKTFVSYCRLVPGSSNSSTSRRHKSGSKDGNKYLRMAFSQAAVSAYSHYGPVNRFYKKIKRRSGKKVARSVVAKELAKIIWHMLTKNEEYKGFKGQPTRVAAKPNWPQPISLQS